MAIISILILSARVPDIYRVKEQTQGSKTAILWNAVTSLGENKVI